MSGEGGDYLEVESTVEEMRATLKLKQSALKERQDEIVTAEKEARKSNYNLRKLEKSEKAEKDASRFHFEKFFLNFSY